MYTIGDAAKATNLPTKTVRYYADINLVTPSGRSDNGYRLYSDKEINKLIFTRRARSFGFSVQECRELLDLYENRDRSSRDVKAIALHRITVIEEKLQELQSLHDELSHLAETCNGDDRPDCPIIDGLVK
ncbi:Cu(I)-responsive transcriptional regulator [Sneathiella marina]|uniref:Cu(I)-responsive transcriptional regulator n=1 Tax=Sneathiella marina TaxID=2950108 RepID=A0ABY4VXF3_9PROT|nr:Cu(I)-responsive transcriptional regulator [Sneathiella marina]USG59550.1 Cu(I)-responsive transcriptional regulator [Sneathiella marina]